MADQLGPKFKVGDKVRWHAHRNEECVITDGPFEPGVRNVGSELGYGFDQYSYVVAPSTGERPRLVGEGALAPVEQWVDCPGEHKPNPGSCIHAWQRRVS